MDTPIKRFPRDDLRVSDADRDRAVAELSEHFQTGRLAQEEFEDRAGRALQARTGRELSELFTDLPQGQARAGTSPAAVNPGGVRRAGRAPTPRIVIACVIAVIIVGNVLGNVFGNAHGSHFGWLIPVLILGFVFRRMVRNGN
jgi:hypothetical protein